MKKIMVLGTPGSGKTFLSKKLSGILGIKVYHLDRLMWNPGWHEKPFEEMVQIQEDILQKDSWIIDGYYHKIADARFAQADTIILLNLPRCVCLCRAILRALHSERPDIADGCRNKADLEFLKYIWHYKGTQIHEIEERLATHSDNKRIIILKRKREVKRLISSIFFNF